MGAADALRFAVLLVPAGLALGTPAVLSGYRATIDSAGRTRAAPHRGVDFAASPGDPVLAAADGVVNNVFPDIGCLRIWHDEFNRFTHYCMVADISVAKFDRVKRGQRVATVGEPRGREGPGVAMLHFDLTNYARIVLEGDAEGSFDPATAIAGCFDATRQLPGDRLVLTYPLACK